MTGPAWLALIVALIAFWPATCELTRLGHRASTRRDIRRLEHHANRTTEQHRKEKP
jgi:hypothetical protein